MQSKLEIWEALKKGKNVILNKLVSVRWRRRLAKPGLAQISGEKTTGVAHSVLHLHVSSLVNVHEIGVRKYSHQCA